MSLLNLNCPVCSNVFTRPPKIMPCCGQTVCLKCMHFLVTKNAPCSQCICLICKDEVDLPQNQEYVSNNQVPQLLKEQAENECQAQVKQLEINCLDLAKSLSTSSRKIKTVCDFIRNDIDVKAESTVDLVYKFRDKLEQEVDQYERETLKALEGKTSEITDLKNLIKSVETFAFESKNARKSNLHECLQAVSEAKRLQALLKIHFENLDNFIFNGKFLKFHENPRLNSTTLLGSLTFDLKDVNVKFKELDFEKMQKISLIDENTLLKLKLVYLDRQKVGLFSVL